MRFGISLNYLWLSHWLVALTPGYKEGLGGGLGIMLVGTASWAFAFASIIYIAGLIWWRNRD